MNKATVILSNPEEKKHSVLYKADAGQVNPAITSAYVMKSALGTPFPAKIKVSIEEAK